MLLVHLFLPRVLLHRQIPGMMVVTAYGAKGNGVTDDTKAIQAAVNTAEALPDAVPSPFQLGPM